jgi:hypothetical protein
MRECLWRDLPLLLHAVHVHSESQLLSPALGRQLVPFSHHSKLTDSE